MKQKTKAKSKLSFMGGKDRKESNKRELAPDIVNAMNVMKNLDDDTKQALSIAERMDEIKDRNKALSWSDRRRLKKNPESSFIITMFYSNGTSRTFVLKSKQKTFMHRKKMYVLLEEDVWFDLSLNQFHFFYHETCSTPINREIAFVPDVDAPAGKQEAFFSVTPSNLKDIIKMEYVKALASAMEISKYLKLIALLAVLAIMGGLITIGMMYAKFYR